jgi:hypothetical protein
MVSSSELFNQIRFGFEYETLLEIKQDPGLFFGLKGIGKKEFPKRPLSYLAMQKIIRDYIDNNKCDDTETPKTNLKKKSHQHIINRYLLAYILNFISKIYKDGSVEFTATNGYGQSGCQTLPIKKEPKASDKKIWTITHDPSVKYTPEASKLYQNSTSLNTLGEPGYLLEYVEFVSPPLKVSEVSSIENMLSTVQHQFWDGSQSFALWHNQKTSNHVHLSCGNYFNSTDNVIKFCMAWWYFEPIFMSLCSEWRRNNEYAQPMRELMKTQLGENDNHNGIFLNLHPGNFDIIFHGMTGMLVGDFPRLPAIIQLFQGNPFDQSSRYTALNLLNLVPGRIGTIEIRIKEGTTDPENIKAFIHLLCAFTANVLAKNCITQLLSPQDREKFLEPEQNKDILINYFFDKFIGVPSLKEYWGQVYNQMNKTLGGKKKQSRKRKSIKKKTPKSK